ncbi:hypothetical protein [Nocardia sp. NBC_01009]|uniref:hypothetical protein n=1 Tax=Nocardia sp. NBC_01009 TaxID=2975996 RepID=UPI00386F50A1|nr:hypothetical protein OHA42_23485 [Nocardia sp. NBC_01009]
MNSAADVVAELCPALPRLRRRAALVGRSSDVEDLLSRARAGQASEDDVTELALRLGLPESEVRGAGPLPGRAGGGPVDEWFRCPAGECKRRERRGPSGPIPECHLDEGSERPLHRMVGGQRS